MVSDPTATWRATFAASGMSTSEQLREMQDRLDERCAKLAEVMADLAASQADLTRVEAERDAAREMAKTLSDQHHGVLRELNEARAAAIEITDQMIYAFAGEPEITATDAHTIRVGLTRALTVGARAEALAASQADLTAMQARYEEASAEAKEMRKQADHWLTKLRDTATDLAAANYSNKRLKAELDSALGRLNEQRDEGGEPRG